MNRHSLLREALEFALIGIAAGLVSVLVMSAASCVVGGRAPSPSPGVATATPAVSEMAPARPRPSNDGPTVQGGNGEDVASGELSVMGLPPSSLEPASTVTQSALTNDQLSDQKSYVVIDAVPATPVTSARPVETIGPESINRATGAKNAQVQPSAEIGQLIAASPWPQSLWGTVACLVERESGGLAWKVGGLGERGLMQVGPANITFLAEKGIAWDALFDGATNLRAGWLLYLWWQGVNGDGLTPWRSTRGGCS